jgi:hypothetical protein
MYKPDILSGGRSWLLPLLQAKPLYHAALALSAHHRRILMLENADQTLKISALVQEGKHLESCVKLLQNSSENGCSKNGLGVLTGVLQLFLFEVMSHL